MNSDDFTPVAYYERYCENVLNQHHEIGTRGHWSVKGGETMKTRTMSLLRKRSAKATVFVILCLLTGVAPAEEWKSAAPIPQGAEEVYGIAGGGKLYVFGGLGLEWKAIGMVMEYDPAIDRWTRKRDMPHRLHHVALAEAGGRIYMFGGFTLPEKGKPAWFPGDQAWEYDPQVDQ